MQNSIPPYIKPFLRGHFHQAAFFMGVGACLMLVSQASTLRSFIAALIYSLSVCILYGVSALYHRNDWKPRMRFWMKRFDHSAIFILISGTVTPVALLALPENTGRNLLLTTWGTSIIGIFQAFFWSQAPKWVRSLIYLCAGWIIIIFLPDFKTGLDEKNIALLVSGGIVYSVGAIVYAFKRPNPFPRIFGYHEIFHIFVIIATILHFLVVNHLVN